MKKAIIFTISLLAATGVFAGPVSVIPWKVKKSFHKHFSEAKHVHWHKQSKGYYEADFSDKGRTINAYFDATGKLKETDIEIKWKKLPVLSRNYIANFLAGGKIERIMVISDKETDAPFIVELHKDKKCHWMFFGRNGDLLEYHQSTYKN